MTDTNGVWKCRKALVQLLFKKSLLFETQTVWIKNKTIISIIIMSVIILHYSNVTQVRKCYENKCRVFTRVQTVNK